MLSRELCVCMMPTFMCICIICIITRVLFQCAASPGRNTPIPLKTVTTNTTPHQFCNNLVWYLSSSHWHLDTDIYNQKTISISTDLELSDYLSIVWHQAWLASRLQTVCGSQIFEIGQDQITCSVSVSADILKNLCQCVFWWDAEICPRLSPLLLTNV